MRLRAAISAYRWPIYLGGILAMSVVAQGVLVYVATRPDAPRPIQSYYQRSLEWDAEAATAAASGQLGWSVRYEVPTDAPHTPSMPRPVDVIVTAADGSPVGGLVGKLLAIRPADSRLSQSGALTEIPHLPGTYRTLIRLDEPGVWELRLDVARGASHFVHTERVTLAESGSAPQGVVE